MTGEPGAKGAPRPLADKRAQGQDVLGLGERERDAVLAWVGENLALARRSVSGQRILYWSLGIGFVIGLAAHIGGFLLKTSAAAEPWLLVADLLYALGWALWTGVVLVVFVEVYPEAKRRQFKRALDAYEAAVGNQAQTGNGQAPDSATVEAVGMYRELAEADPGRYRPDLAQSLASLAVRLSALGRLAEAVQVTEEAVAIYRELAGADPGRYRPGLAQSLAGLGIRFWELGRLAEAVQVTEEAVAIYRELAGADPGRYRPDLARSLRVLADSLDLLGRGDDASAARAEAATFGGEPAE
jgi:tetratricopeptide (TPR) repeat protein